MDEYRREHLAKDLAFPALSMKLYTEFENARGDELGFLVGRQFVEAIDHALVVEAIDYALVNSKASTDYLSALLAASNGDREKATLILALARYGERHKLDPDYIAAVIMLPFAAEGYNEDDRVEDRVRRLYEAEVPAEYAVALKGCKLSVTEVVQLWQDGVSAEYVTAV